MTMGSMEKLLKKLKKYRIEVVILTIAFLIAIVSLLIFLNTYQKTDEEIQDFSLRPSSFEEQVGGQAKIYIDVSGSVNKPDSYEASNGIRLKDLIKKAGGLSDSADKSFFARNFNLARIVSDQEKIYVPSVWEVGNGYFVENQQMLDYNSPGRGIASNAPTDNKININSATIEELDTLPGVGKVTAQKIIDNRPFGALEELLNKKIVNKSIFENIKDLITI